MLVTPWPSLRQAILRRLRSNFVLKAELSGDWTESVAPQNTPFPHGIINQHYDPVAYDWDGQTVTVGFDVVVFSKVNTAEAARLDQLAYSTLQDAALDPTGQTSILCRRISSIPSYADADAEGKTVYVAGGLYEAKVTQDFPANHALTVTLDCTIA